MLRNKPKCTGYLISNFLKNHLGSHISRKKNSNFTPIQYDFASKRSTKSLSPFQQFLPKKVTQIQLNRFIRFAIPRAPSRPANRVRHRARCSVSQSRGSAKLSQQQSIHIAKFLMYVRCTCHARLSPANASAPLHS